MKQYVINEFKTIRKRQSSYLNCLWGQVKMWQTVTTVPSAGKMIPTVFSSSHGVIGAYNVFRIKQYHYRWALCFTTGSFCRIRLRPNVHSWPNRKCIFIKIMRLHINIRSLLQNSVTYVSRCFHMSHIRWIWFSAITFSFQNWKNYSLDEN